MATNSTASRGTEDRGTARRGIPAPASAVAPPATSPPDLFVRQLRLHLYLPIGYPKHQLVTFLEYDHSGAGDGFGDAGDGPFAEAGITINLVDNLKSAVTDFNDSLQVPGAIVVYLGHTSLLLDAAKKRYVKALGLNPNEAKAVPITSAQLRGKLAHSRCAMVLLAGCMSNTLVARGQKSQSLVVTTDSGRNGGTDSRLWARAITAFLFALVGWHFDGKIVVKRPGGRATVDQALAAARPLFRTDDQFVLAIGDGRRTLT